MKKDRNVIYVRLSSIILWCLLMLFIQQCAFGGPRTLTLEEMRTVNGNACSADQVADDYPQWWCSVPSEHCIKIGQSCGGGSCDKCLGTDWYLTNCAPSQTTQGCSDYTQNCGSRKQGPCDPSGDPQNPCYCNYGDAGICTRAAVQTVSSCP